MLNEKETTVYKRALEGQYQLKLKASRAVFSEVNKKYPTMPFTLRALTGTGGLMVVAECSRGCTRAKLPACMIYRRCAISCCTCSA